MSVADTYANNAARITLAQGDAQAQAALQRGQIWGQAVNNIGQIPAQMSLQQLNQLKMQEANQNLQMGTMKMTEMQREMATRDAIGQAMVAGQGNRDVLKKAILSDPLTAPSWPEIEKGFLETDQKRAQVTELGDKHQQAQAEDMGALANRLQTVGDTIQGDPQRRAEVMHGLLFTELQQRVKDGIMDAPTATQIIAGGLTNGVPDPQKVDALTAAMKANSKTFGSPEAAKNAAQAANDAAQAAVHARVLSGMSPTGITAEQKAELDRQKAANAETARHNLVDEATARANAATSRMNAERAARDSNKPQIFYDAEGKPRALQFVNGATKEVALPADIAGKGNAPSTKPLPATTAENLSGINEAEVQGVKVLRQLKASGLDQSNDPADPRWNKFLVTTLKVAPSDFNKADIQQRTAFVTAVLTRGLMGGRPSQYVAQMIQQHMPQGEMSGQQLYHVMSNVLEEGGGRRGELEGLMQRPAGSLSPKTGETYSQFLQSLSNSTTPKANPFR